MIIFLNQFLVTLLSSISVLVVVSYLVFLSISDMMAETDNPHNPVAHECGKKGDMELPSMR